MNSVLLTIDDAPSRNTPALVDYLREKGIRAILFATGQNVERFYAEAVHAVRNGMIVGNHSYSHPGFSALPLEECVEEIERCEAVLDRLYRDSGVPRTVRPFRFPYGDKGGVNKDALQRHLRERAFDKVDDTHISYAWWKQHGMNTDVDTFWTFDFEEYRLYQEPAFTVDAIRKRMLDMQPEKGAALFGAENRHILLMHDHDETEAILPRYYQCLLDCLLERGVVFDEPRFMQTNEIGSSR